MHGIASRDSQRGGHTHVATPARATRQDQQYGRTGNEEQPEHHRHVSQQRAKIYHRLLLVRRSLAHRHAGTTADTIAGRANVVKQSDPSQLRHLSSPGPETRPDPRQSACEFLAFRPLRGEPGAGNWIRVNRRVRRQGCVHVRLCSLQRTGEEGLIAAAGGNVRLQQVVDQPVGVVRMRGTDPAWPACPGY